MANFKSHTIKSNRIYQPNLNNHYRLQQYQSVHVKSCDDIVNVSRSCVRSGNAGKIQHIQHMVIKTKPVIYFAPSNYKKKKLLHPDPQYFKINTIISCTHEPPRDQDHMCCMWGVQSEAALTWKINTDNRSWHIDIIAGDLFWTEASFEWCTGENEHPLCCVWGEITLKWLLLWKSLAWNEVVSAGFHSVSGEIWGRGWTCSYLWWMLTF